MDDCNLDKLGVKPGKLEPAFKRDITEYNIIVASDVEKLSFDPLTSDTGASYSISVWSIYLRSLLQNICTLPANSWSVITCQQSIVSSETDWLAQILYAPLIFKSLSQNWIYIYQEKRIKK